MLPTSQRDLLKVLVVQNIKGFWALGDLSLQRYKVCKKKQTQTLWVNDQNSEFEL